jgi:hypothetical protein
MAAPVIVEARTGVSLAPDAAASFRRAEADWGSQIGVNSAYRDYWLQLAMYTAWLAYVAGNAPYPGHSRAIHPDASMHCRGLAIDTPDWWRPGFLAFMADRGWIQILPNDPTERHHLEYQWWRDNHRNRPAPAGDSATPFPQEDPMPTLREIYEAVWHGFTFKSGRTPGQELVQQGTRLARLELQLADLRAQGTGRFFKHGNRAVTLWVFVHESGDFVRIRDEDTAKLYRALNGGKLSTTVTGEALRQMIADLSAAGGRDLAAVPDSEDTTVTSAEQIAADDETFTDPLATL